MSSLTEQLKALPVGPRTPNATYEPEFTKRLERKGDTITLNVKKDIPEGTAFTFLKDEGLNPEEWEVTGFRKSEWGAEGAEQSSCAFTFKRKAGTGGTLTLPDLDDLHLAVKRDRKQVRGFQPPTTTRSSITSLADFQVGKVGDRGTTEDLLGRLEDSLDLWGEYIWAHEPNEIILADLGDIIENFENTGQQARTNDLQLTEQIRVARRIVWSWVDKAAAYRVPVKVVGIPSNHCQVRRGKDLMGNATDDYGLEIIAQVHDICAANPEKYGHVEFFTPSYHNETVSLKTVSGKILGFAHGHQVSNPDKLEDYIKGQVLGRGPLGDADICIFGHWHQLRVQTYGQDRWIFISPTSDNGSAWFRNISGKDSKPGVMNFLVDEDGWSNLYVC